MKNTNNKVDKEILNSNAIQNIWENATPKIGHNPQKERCDMFGNLIARKDLLNKESEFGWDFTSIIVNPNKTPNIVTFIPVSYKAK